MTRATRRLSRATILLATATALLVACGGDDDTTPDLSETERQAEPGPADGKSAEPDVGATGEAAGDPADASGGQVIAASAVTCEASAEADPATSPPVPCDRAHTTETFRLTGTDDLDDCYRAVAASSDILVGVDDDDETELDFTDDRVSGHSFSGFDDEVTCSVFLAEPSATQLIGR